MAALPIAIATALIPHIPGIIKAVEGLFGRGDGQTKRQAAIDLAKKIPAVTKAVGVDNDAIGQIVDLGVGILTAEGTINQHKAPTVPTGIPAMPTPKVGLPTAIQVAAQENADGSITLVVPAPELRRPS